MPADAVGLGDGRGLRRGDDGGAGGRDHARNGESEKESGRLHGRFLPYALARAVVIRVAISEALGMRPEATTFSSITSPGVRRMP